MNQDRVFIKGYRGKTIAVGTAAVQETGITAGVYDVSCDVDCYLRIANRNDTTPNTALEVTAANGYLLYAKNTVSFQIDAGDSLGIIAVSAGTFRMHRVG